jgi:hypothetical protein
MNPLQWQDSSDDDDGFFPLLGGALEIFAKEAAKAGLPSQEEKEEEEEEEDDDDQPKRKKTRKAKTQFNYQGAKELILQNHFGPNPKFKDDQFKMFYRISKSRFQAIMEDLAPMPFYSKTKNALGKEGICLEAKLLLPLKTLAYGVAPHCFIDQFQMSAQMAAVCCKEFAKAIIQKYQSEYKRIPTTQHQNRAVFVLTNKYV